MLTLYIKQYYLANFFNCIMFRSILATLLSLLISLLMIPKFISYCKKLQNYAQPIREYTTEAHKKKIGTPTMGGVIIIISVIISSFLLSDFKNLYVLTSLFVLVSFCVLGAIDDYIKVKNNNAEGISKKKKLAFQFLLAMLACFMLQKFTNLKNNTYVYIPFSKNLIINLNYFYLPFIILIIVSSSNAVNLTDGLDGLVIFPIIIILFIFTLLSYFISYYNYIDSPYVSELSIVCGATIGASVGFLWFNAPPAEIFMGDSGSLSLGAVLGYLSIVTKHELFFSIISGLFIIETLSVIIQIYYFKFTKGKRFFKMAPLHHHFEKLGWPESKIVIRFWVITIIFVMIGLLSLTFRY